MPEVVRIGTRGSSLALAQAGQIKRRLEKRHPKFIFKLVTIQTSGDEFQSVEWFKKTGTGLFTKAIEQKLLENKIDLAVHSLKDLPTTLPKGLCLAAFPKRADVRDVLISRKGYDLSTLPAGAWVGTASPRRKSQLFLKRSDLRIKDIRGNLDTRVRKVLDAKELDAIVVARAGLLRLNRYLKYAKAIPEDDVLPAVGQGALALEIREEDSKTLRLVKFLNDQATRRRVLAERAFLKTLQGGCRVPVGISSAVKGRKIFLTAAVFSAKTSASIFEKISGAANSAEILGRRLAQKLLKKGARKFLVEARGQ
jgi:hydroxymethylbilane synthase